MAADKQVKELEQKILKHKKLYYSGKAEISDQEFDQIESQLRELDPQNPVLFMVGSNNPNNKVPHQKKMLSLQKSYDVEELIKWKGDEAILSTEKIDGSSCSIIYINKSLVLAKTRGDGSFGENITTKIEQIPSIPQEVKLDDDFEVRGEVYCDEKNFHDLTIEMEKRGLEKPSSMRNIVAGLLGRKENIELARFLSFKAFDFISNGNKTKFKKESEKLELLKKLGFQIPDYVIHKTKSTIDESLEETRNFMSDGDYLIDGIVFTYNDISLHDKLGETSHHPRYKMAFKFAGESKQTQINSITWQVSRNGVLTPVAEVETVEVSGANVSRVTLHNWGMVKDFKLKTGDTIEIERSGEVIPKFIQVIESSENEFEKPEKCPSCSQKIIEEEIRLKCVNPDCPDKNLEATKYFLKSLGIDDLSTERIREMFDRKVLEKTADVFSLTPEVLVENLDGYKEKLATKVVKNIQKKKEVELLDFLVSLGITGGGKTKCEKLLDELELSRLEQVQKLTVDQLSSVEGFAVKSSESFIESLKEKEEFIESLLEAGLVVKAREVIQKGDSLAGQTFCITGALERPRTEIQNWIKLQGGKPVSSVSAKTDFLVCNEKSNSSKYLKAEKLGIKIITEDELYALGE